MLKNVDHLLFSFVFSASYQPLNFMRKFQNSQQNMENIFYLYKIIQNNIG